MTQNQVPNLGSLFQTAHEEGDLSARSLQALNVPAVGMQLQAGLGLPALNVPSSELVLAALLIDDSGSITFRDPGTGVSNQALVQDGHNLVIDSLLGSKQKSSVMFSSRYIHGFVLNPWCLLENATRMDPANFRPMGDTPLFEQTVIHLGSVLAKALDAKQNGQLARTISLIVTDGAENASRKVAQDVASIVSDMLAAETHIIAAMGVEDGYTDFRAVFRSMGIEDKWILTPGNTPPEIRHAFQTFSSSAVQASQSAASFSQTAAGGFATP